MLAAAGAVGCVHSACVAVSLSPCLSVWSGLELAVFHTLSETPCALQCMAQLPVHPWNRLAGPLLHHESWGPDFPDQDPHGWRQEPRMVRHTGGIFCGSAKIGSTWKASRCLRKTSGRGAGKVSVGRPVPPCAAVEHGHVAHVAMRTCCNPPPTRPAHAGTRRSTSMLLTRTPPT